MIDAEIIAVGDELLIGQVVNTNASWLGEQLFGLGSPVRVTTVVGDEIPAITAILGRALERSDVIIVTGGLGPTHDDVTKSAMCEFFHMELVEDLDVLAQITVMFARRGIGLTPSNRSQALVPRGCTVLTNPIGTAPGMRFDRDGKIVFVLPGVPREMKRLFDDWIRPVVAGLGTSGVIARTLNTTGIPESLLFEKIGPVPDVTAGNGKLAFLPSVRGVRLRITVEAATQQEADEIATRMDAFIRQRAGEYVYGVGDETLEQVIGSMLRARGMTLAVAESCTGGMISDWITNVPGSSEYFLGGFVTYANAVKTAAVGVPAALIDTVGAVSSEVAEAMARGARERTGADIAIATTGIAGPDGGSDENPVGTVWISISDTHRTTSARFVFGAERAANKERFAAMALELLRRHLLATTAR